MNIGDLVRVKPTATIGYISHKTDYTARNYFNGSEFRGSIARITKLYKGSSSIEVSYNNYYVHLGEEDVEPYFLL